MKWGIMYLVGTNTNDLALLPVSQLLTTTTRQGHSFPTILGMKLLQHIDPRSAKIQLLICFVPGCESGSLWPWKRREWVEEEIEQAS